MATEEIRRQVVIIGSGPAGLTAAIYTARANLNPLLIDAPADTDRQTTPGGQLMITTEVENYPGFAKGIDGPELMMEFRRQAERFGTEFLEEWIHKVELQSRPFTLHTDNRIVKAETLIIASGASAKWLHVPGEAKTPKGFGGNGVSACATCDGFFFRGKEVVVVGGGNTAVEEALYLTNHARRVTLVHRRDALRAEKILQDRLFRHPKIDIIWNAVVEEIIGVPEPPQVTGVRLLNLRTGAVSEHACDGVFIAIGHSPVTGLVAGQLPLDPEGYVKTRPDSTATAIPGVFAAGDVKDKIFRQAVTAAGMGCMAALEAEKFLAAREEAATMRAAE